MVEGGGQIGSQGDCSEYGNTCQGYGAAYDAACKTGKRQGKDGSGNPGIKPDVAGPFQSGVQ